MSAPSPSGTAPAWVALAVFGQPHGVSGRIKVKSFTDPADDFASHALTDEAGTPYKLKITGHAQGLPIVTIEGITDRNQVALLRGRKIGIARAELPPIDQPDRFYTDDLIGMEVVDGSGQYFGEVAAVANYGAGDILNIRRPGGQTELYAFTHATFPTVDMAARRIAIEPPDILRGDPDDRN